MGGLEEEFDCGVDEEVPCSGEGGGIDDLVATGGEGSAGGEVGFAGGDVDGFADVTKFDDERGLEGGGFFDLEAEFDEHLAGECDDGELTAEGDDLKIDGEGIAGTGLGGGESPADEGGGFFNL